MSETTQSGEGREPANGETQTEKLYRLFIETDLVGAWALDRNLCTAFVNANMARMLGYSAEEIVGRSPEDFVFPEDLSAHRERMARRRAGKGSAYEMRFRRRDGSAIWGIVIARAMMSETGEFAGAFAMFTDVTRLKQAELNLRESESFLNSVIEQSPYPTWISDHAGTLIRLNEACRKLLHITDEEVVGKYNILRDSIVEKQGFMPLVRRVFEAGETVQFEIHYDSSQLRDLPLERSVCVVLATTVFPVRDARGEIAHAVIQHMDITDRNRAEEALRESEEKYRTLIERARDGIIIVQDGIVVYSNARMAELDGSSIEQIVGTPYTDHVHPDQLVALAENYRQRMARESLPSVYETVLRRHDGTAAPAELNACAVTYNGKVADMVIIRDITERKRAEKALRDSEEKYRILTEATPDVIWQLSLDLRFLYVNSAVQKALGYAPAEVIGQPLAAFFVPERLDQVHQIIGRELQHIATHTGVVFETEMRHRDGHSVALEIHGMIQKDEQGRPTGFQGVSRDVGERKKTAAKMAEQLEELRRWHSALLGREGRVLELKREVNRLLGEAGKPIRYPVAETDTEKGIA